MNKMYYTEYNLSCSKNLNCISPYCNTDNKASHSRSGIDGGSRQGTGQRMIYGIKAS